MGTISQNQYDYLSNLVKGGGGNAIWALNQLEGNTIESPKPPTQTNPVPANSGNSSGMESPAAYKPPSSNIGPTNPVPSGTMFLGQTPSVEAPAKYTPPSVPMPQGQTPTEVPQNKLVMDGPSNSLNQFIPPSYTPYVPKAPAIPVRDRNQIASYVDQQLAKALADAARNKDQALQTAENDTAQSQAALNTQLQQAINRITTGATQATQGVQTGYDRMRQNITQDRTVENNQMGRQLDPFSGRSDYAYGVMAQERARTDREQQEDLTSRLGNINQDASTAQTNATLDTQTRLGAITQDLDALKANINQNYQALKDATPAQREALIMQIEKDERAYDLALRGEDRADIQQNAALQNQAYQQALQQFQTNRGVLESDRGYNLDVSKFDYMKDWNQYNSNIDLAKWLTETYGTNAVPKSNAGVAFDQVSGQVPLNQQAIYYQQARDKIKDSQWQQQFDAEYKQFGLEYALKAQAQRDAKANADKDNAYQSGMLKLNQDKFAADQKQLLLENSQVSNDELDRLTTRFLVQDPYDKTVSVPDPNGLRQAIVMLKDKSGNYLSDADITRLLKLYGIPEQVGN